LTKKTIITTEKAPKPIRPYYSQAVKVKDASLLFISGQTWDPSADPPAKGDVKAQTRAALEHIKAILEAAGGRMEDIVKVTVYVKDIGDLDKIAEVRYEYFHTSPPASTLVEVSKFWNEDVLIEIEAVALVR